MVNKKTIIQMSKELGLVGVSKKTKPVLIRLVQEAEGNSPCFQSIPDCSIQSCMFREECV